LIRALINLAITARGAFGHRGDFVGEVHRLPINIEILEHEGRESFFGRRGIAHARRIDEVNSRAGDRR